MPWRIFRTALWVLVPILAAPAHGQESVARGAYLVQLLGCGRCHTEGHLTGNVGTAPHLAGSRIGIAYTSGNQPGVVFPSNLTPDPETGIGEWTRVDIVNAMTRGQSSNRHETLTVMPWMDYNVVTESDLGAIADYLLSLPAVSRKIPDPIPAGAQPTHEYVRFGIYRFTPMP